MGVVPSQNSIQILKKLVPLNMLSEEDLEHLLETATFKKEKAGTYLFRQGDTDYHNVYLLSGQVAILDKMREVDRVAAGSETARFPLAHQNPRKNSVRAIGRVEYVLIDNRKLSELLVKSSDDDYKVSDLSAAVTDDWMAQLLQSNVFQQIPAANIQGVIMRMEEVDVKRGKNVIEQGGDGDYFYLIHKGQCSVLRKSESDDEPKQLAKLGPGDSFGEEALLSDSPRNSTVRMSSDGVLLRLSKDDFIEFVKRPLARGVIYSEAENLVKDGAVWLDVRPLEDYGTGHLSNSLSFPMNTLRYQAANLAADQHYVICCDNGQTSATAAFLLTDRGYNVSVLEGGLRSVPAEVLIQEGSGANETSAKVIDLRSGEEVADETGAGGPEEITLLKSKLQEANHRIKDLGAKFQLYRDKQLKESSQRDAELKAQKVILDKTRKRLDELRDKRNTDLKSLEKIGKEKKALTASLDEMQERITTSGSMVSELETALKEQQGIQQSLQKEKEDIQKQLDTEKQELQQLQQEQEQQKLNTAEQKQLGEEQLETKQREYEESLAALKQELNDTRGNLDQKESKHLELQTKIDELLQGQKGLEEQHDSASAELTQQLEQATSKLDEKKQVVTDLQSKLEQLQDDLAKRESELENLQKKGADSDQAMGELQSELEVATKDLQKRESELEQVRKSGTDSEQAMSELQADLEKATNKLQKRESELEQLQKSGTDSEQAMSELQKELEKATNKLQKRESELELLKKSGTDSEQAMSELQSMREQAEAEFHDLQQKHEQDATELAELRQARDRLESELTDLRKTQEQSDTSFQEMQDAKEQRETALSELEQERERLESELQELQSTQAHNEDELKQLREAQDNSKTGLGEMQELNRKSAAELEALENAKREVESMLTDLQVKYEGTESEFVDLKSKFEIAESELQQERKHREDIESELKQAAGSQEPNEEIKVLRTEIQTLNEALEESDIAYDQIREKAEELLDEREVNGRTIIELESNLAGARREVERLAADAQSGTESSVLEQEAEKLRQEANALREELNLVQQHSNTEIDGLRSELINAQSKLDTQTEDSGQNKLVEEGLRQELEKLQKSTEAWEHRQAESDEKVNNLEDALEDRDERIDLMQVELEEARQRVEESERAQMKYEEKVNLMLDSNNKDEKLDEYVDTRMTGTTGVVDMESYSPGHTSKGMLVLWFFLGAIITFGVLDGIMIVSGKGELITGLLQEQPTTTVSSQTTPKGRISPVPDFTEPSPRQIAEQPTVQANLPAGTTKEDLSKEPEPIWSMLTDIQFGPPMIKLRGGLFIMGSNRNQVSSNEWPAHEVEIKRFAISQTEVTFDDYDRFAQATGRKLPEDAGWGRGTRPVINVSWNEAVAYTEWLSERTGKKYRLPTEAEWEYAVRGGSDSTYWWGYQVDEGRANCFDCGSQWDRSSTAPVGSFPSNEFGLHDMVGNVREWVQDCYFADYEGAPSDGTAWLEPGCETRVVRGGAYNKTSDSMRSSWRGHFKPDSRLTLAGFRVVRELE